jgi:Sec-independent protein translocase protein TatA
MLGFSMAELIVVFIVILVFIKPQDLPEIAHFLGRAFFRLKKIYYDLKKNFSELEELIEFNLNWHKSIER